MVIYGGTAQEWAAAKRLAKRDLLPVVSNPHVQLGKFSKMKELGKTPSQVIETQDGPRAIGFSDWTAFEATAVNIEAWSKVPDHGICIQTRLIRAIDIDVEDAELADEIEAWFFKRLGPTAVRERAGSGRRILAYRAEGGLRRASFPTRETVAEDGKTKRELVELLGDGQQFVAAGMHKSGERYAWRGGFPKPADLVELEVDELVAVFEAAHAKFSCGDLRMAGRRDPTLPEDLDVADPVAEYLIKNWPSYSCEHGKLYIDCPAKHRHSEDNGETETSWLLAGTGQFRNGHFSCLHQSCKEEVPNDDAFFRAVGYRAAQASDFEDISSEDERLAAAYVALSAKPKGQALPDPRGKLPLPGFLRNERSGRILTTLENVVLGLRNPQACDCWLAYDEFLADLMIADEPDQWRPLTDADAVELRIRLERLGFENAVGKDMLRDALVRLSAEQRMDSAIKWLTEVVPAWDGVSRIGRFWPDYMQTADTPYTRALGLYTWTAQAARILDPGCQVDMVPVLVSPEGYRKTTAIKALVPARQFYNSFRLEMKDEDIARLMRGRLVGELAELRGIGARDGEAVKDWVTRTEETWTQKYQERSTTMPRRLLFYGTTNDDDFLSAHMGDRRWLPAHITAQIDTGMIERDRLQLWAEAKAIYDIDGVLWADVERLARKEREAFRPEDEWVEKVLAWLDDATDIENGQTPRMVGVRGDQVLTECLSLDARNLKKADQMRVGNVLKTCRMVRIQKWIGGRNQKVWIDAGGADEAQT